MFSRFPARFGQCSEVVPVFEISSRPPQGKRIVRIGFFVFRSLRILLGHLSLDDVAAIVLFGDLQTSRCLCNFGIRDPISEELLEQLQVGGYSNVRGIE